MSIGTPIREGGVYVYTAGIPAKCKGFQYRVLRCDVLSVPDYTRKVLVEALNGPDKGLLFVCSPANFSTRYTQLKVVNGTSINNSAVPVANT